MSLLRKTELLILEYLAQASQWGNESAFNEETQETEFQSGKMPWWRAGQPTPECLPGESHGQRSLASYSPSGHKESVTTEVTEHAHAHIQLAQDLT